MIITISDSNNVVPSELFIEKIDSIIIPNNELCYMSIIEDVYVGDSSIYALDTSANLIKINLFSGQVEKARSLRGHSESECVMPKAITSHDNKVYVLDMQGMKILILDNNFNYVKSVRIPVPAMDLAIIPNGFLLFNLNATVDEGMVININKDGLLVNDYIPSRGNPELILSQHIFNETETGILMVPPMQNELYEYSFEKDSINCLYKYHFGSINSKIEGIGTNMVIPSTAIQAFETERYLITNYYYNQIMGTCVRDKKLCTTNSGLIKTDLPYSFNPQAIKDNIVYAVYERGFSSQNESRYILMKYHLKN